MAKYIREVSPFNTRIVALGVDTYLKMLLQDNFVHTDLHPGNILVRARVPRGGFGGAPGGGKAPGGNPGAGLEASVTLPEALAAAAASADPARGAAEVAERLQLVRVTLPHFEGICQWHHIADPAQHGRGRGAPAASARFD